MPFFYTEQKFHSKQNGELRYQRFWDRSWLVKVPQGEYYSGNYLENMWRIIPRRYVGDTPKDVLILGCGACCAIDSVLKLWPEARIDALDYDPTIIEIGKTIYGDFKDKKVNLIVADARDFIAKTTKKYDLIIIDIFYGNRPSAILKEAKFLNDIEKITVNNGTIIANLATSMGGKDEEIFQAWQAKFPETTIAKYHGNRLGIYIKKEIPEDYYNLRQNRSGTLYDVQKMPLKTCTINAMHTDVEPDVEMIKKETGAKHGLIIWSPWKKSFAEKPWRRIMLPPIHPKGNGFSYVTQDYRGKWNQTARRDLKNFTISGVEIRSANKEQFLAGLMLSQQKSSIKSMFKSMIDKRQEPIHYWVAEKNKEVIGGLAVMDYYNISYHLAGFISDGEKGTSAGTGLIDHWYKYALKKGLKYLNFGHIRQSGESKAWQGFSDFKRKFIDTEIVIRNQYFRFF